MNLNDPKAIPRAGPRTVLTFALVATVAVLGCGTDPTATTATADDLATGFSLDLAIQEIADSADDPPDATAEIAAETASDTVQVELTGSDSGSCSQPGCPCQANNQCDSGFCFESSDGSLCAQSCTTGCPNGFTCKTVQTGGADLMSVCIPRFARLCEPCTTDEDCVTVGSTAPRCMPYVGPGGDLFGSFCGGSCDAANPCPNNYTCVDFDLGGGASVKQCRKTNLACDCDVRATTLKLATKCSLVGPLGTCGGQRSCGTAGLAACNAPTAQTETCNEVDDDCDGKTDEPGPTVCNDKNACTYDNCVSGQCQHPPATGGCDDENPCTGSDLCANGVCTGQAVGCDDGNPCTQDACAKATGCSHEPSIGGVCSDGSLCTVGDACKGGQCQAGAMDACDDGDLCTADACDPTTGCKHTPNTVPCDDGDVCSLGDACKAGKCLGVAVLACADGNPCSDDACDKVAGCKYTHNSGPCTDNNGCTLTDGCVGGSCQPGEPKSCDDGNPCTTDSCHATTGCKNAANSLPCSDGDGCTEGDSCSVGGCQPGGAKVCNDGNACTDDGCSKGIGCKFEPNAKACSDGNVCSVGDACETGACVPGAAKACDDGKPCTADSCDYKLGCQNPANAAPCDDGSVCTVGDTCDKGSCGPGALVSCNDGNGCTMDSCDAKLGCKSTANQLDCDDGSVCTLDDECVGGSCKAGAAKVCNDNNPCTSDSCNGAIGCLSVVNAAPCQDGSVCTGPDACKDGECTAGPKISCDDGNPCTDDSCDAAKGCQFKANTATCDDGSGCTANDVCAAGKCAGPVGCDKLATCTVGGAGVACVCKAGYKGDGFTCADVDECLAGSTSCPQNTSCSNNVGGYDCTCKAGFNSCDGNPGNGCESTAATDSQNCGGCSKVCPSGDACVGGNCDGGSLTPGNTTKVVVRYGWQIKCNVWINDLCSDWWVKPPTTWIDDSQFIVDKWYRIHGCGGAATFACQVATGNPNFTNSCVTKAIGGMNCLQISGGSYSNTSSSYTQQATTVPGAPWANFSGCGGEDPPQLRCAGW